MHQKYLYYQDTGLDWLGQIPSSWKLIKAKWNFTEKSVKGYPNETLLSVSKGKGVIPRDELETNTVMAFKDLDNFKLVTKEDFVIHLRSFQSGFEMSLNRGIVSPAYTVFNGKEKVEPTYFKYLFYMQSFIDAIASTTQSLRDGKPIAYSEFSKMELPFPSKEEQLKIGNFLDMKLQSLEKIIENKKLLINLLEQQRQSIITEAVTKGLNPNVKMKDSGVEWIGEIPEHWKLTKIKYMAKLLNGDRGENYPSGNDFVDEGIPFITSHNLNNRYVDGSNLKYVSEERYYLLRGIKIKKNDIIYCLRGSVGKNSLVTKDGGTIASSLMGIRASTKINAEFLSYILNSKMEVWNRSMLTTGSVSDNLSAENVGTYLFTFPNLNEQMEIVDYLNSEMLKIEEIIMLVKQQIEKLKEYRQSLIYEAVTGKIDVRDMELD